MCLSFCHAFESKHVKSERVLRTVGGVQKCDVLALVDVEVGLGILAQKPLDPPNRPKPPQTPNFPENLALPRNPPGIPTEFILSAIQNPTEFSEFSFWELVDVLKQVGHVDRGARSLS